MNILELREADGVFDFVVDGISLQAALKTDDLSILRQREHPQEFARELVDADGSLEGHVPIYACRECTANLDTWDGGYAVRVTPTVGCIVWSEIEAFSNAVDQDGEKLVFTPTGVGPFAFDPVQYRATLSSYNE